MDEVSNLIGCIDELHTLVCDGEDDGWDFSHLFCGPLEDKRTAQTVINCSLVGIMSQLCSQRLEEQLL